MGPKDFGFRKRIEADFYITAGGTEPVRDWIRGLDRESKAIIGGDVRKVEVGWPIGLPVCRPLGSSLWEVRSDLPDGTIARIIFSVRGNKMILLHGFIKKTQKTPTHELKLALQRLKSLD